MARVTKDEFEHARRGRDLGEARPKGVLPRLGSDPELLAAWLTAAFRPPPGYEFERFERSSARKTDPCALTFRNGRDSRTFRFDRQGELTSNALRMVVVGASAGWLRMPHLTASEVEDVWVALCTIGRVMSEFDLREETVKWVHNLLDETRPLTGKTLIPDARHDGLMAIRAHGEYVRRDAEQMAKGAEGFLRRPIRFIDDVTGDQYLRSGETATFLWHVLGVRELSRPTLRARLSEIGVEAQRFEAYRPPHPKLTLFRLTEELVEYVESTTPAVPQPAEKAQQKLGETSESGDRMAF